MNYGLVACGADASGECRELLGEYSLAKYFFLSRRPIFHTWSQYKDAMVQQFEPDTEIKEARK